MDRGESPFRPKVLQSNPETRAMPAAFQVGYRRLLAMVVLGAHADGFHVECAHLECEIVVLEAPPGPEILVEPAMAEDFRLKPQGKPV